MHWTRNLFGLSIGAPGKAFINKLTKLINEWASKSPNQGICFKALMVMPSLISQITSNKCKTSEIKSHVERRFNLWENNNVGLLDETIMIQKKASSTTKTRNKT